MNISGVVVRTCPENIVSITKRLSDLDGVEVHGANEDGRLVVTVQNQREAEMPGMLMKVQDMPGVLSASMVYHQFEDLGQQEAEE